MLLLDNALFWSGLALVVYVAALPPLAAVAAVLAIGLAPPVFSALGVIWKDTAMGAALLLAFALLWYAQCRRRRAALALALPFLVYALALRYNAAPAVLPLALWIPFLSDGDRGVPHPNPRRAAVGGLLLFILLAGAAAGLNRLLTNGSRQYPAQTIMEHDLVAISVATGQLYLPASQRTNAGPPTLDAVRCLYEPNDGSALFGTPTEKCPLRLAKIVNAGAMADLEAEWARTVSRHPLMYLAHRWRVFRGQLALDDARVCYPLHVGIDRNDLGLTFSGSPLYAPAMRVLTAAAYRTPLYRAWIYVVLTVALLIARGRKRPAVLALGSSGLLYTLSAFVGSVACDFRYNWWSIVAALVLLVVAASPPRNGFH